MVSDLEKCRIINYLEAEKPKLSQSTTMGLTGRSFNKTLDQVCYASDDQYKEKGCESRFEKRKAGYTQR
jgi:hypothetical protein